MSVGLANLLDDATSVTAAGGGGPVPFVRTTADGTHRLDLMVEGAHCGGCIARIERALGALPGVEQARLNLSTRRLAVRWRGPAERASLVVERLGELGYRAVPFDAERLRGLEAGRDRELLRALAIAGFAAANVMLLSVAVWFGNVSDMGPGVRDLFHWVAALIALPAIVYAGLPFYRSAWASLRARAPNMDVPIAAAILLTAAMSLSETARGAAYTYFDSAVTLLFLLLVGRFLDSRARTEARSAVERLLTMRASSVTLLESDGRARQVAPEDVRPGSTVLVAAGDRIGVDGRVLLGRSAVDMGLVTGESVPATVGPGERVFAGTINLEAPLRLETLATGENTLLAEIARLVEIAGQSRGRYVALADRIARLYTPLVHGLALLTFLVWAGWLGATWQEALLHAVAVLIITCPCALGLAVPAVNVIASGRLLRQGILLKSPTALERLATIDTVVFDKTGTLTRGEPELVAAHSIAPEDLRLAAELAASSRHPLARALARAVPGATAASEVEESPGLGLLLETGSGPVRLGRRDWVGVPPGESEPAAATLETWLVRPGRPGVRFAFQDVLRPDASRVVASLRERGLDVRLLSGDRAAIVAAVAAELGIDQWCAELLPGDKSQQLERLRAQGRRVLMVGDGLNDAPALAAAYVSVSPASAADLSQVAADAVFQGRELGPVLELVDTARRARRFMYQNFVMAACYNLVAVPLAILGLVTPLIAALTMSTSSLLVIGNALRLGRKSR